MVSYQLVLLTALDQGNIGRIILNAGFTKGNLSYSKGDLDIVVSYAATQLKKVWKDTKSVIFYDDLSGNKPSEEYIKVYKKLKKDLGAVKYVSIDSMLIDEPIELR